MHVGVCVAPCLVASTHPWLWCAALGVVAVLAPNSNVLGERFLAWCHKANRGVSFCGALAVGAILFLVLVNTARDSTSAFIYFNF